MIYEQNKLIEVKPNIPTTFELSVIPNWTGKLMLGSSCGCTSFPQNQLDCVENVPVTFQFIMNKSHDYTGKIKYNKFQNGHFVHVAETILTVKVVP